MDLVVIDFVVQPGEGAHQFRRRLRLFRGLIELAEMIGGGDDRGGVGRRRRLGFERPYPDFDGIRKQPANLIGKPGRGRLHFERHTEEIVHPEQRAAAEFAERSGDFGQLAPTGERDVLDMSGRACFAVDQNDALGLALLTEIELQRRAGIFATGRRRRHTLRFVNVPEGECIGPTPEIARRRGRMGLRYGRERSLAPVCAPAA